MENSNYSWILKSEPAQRRFKYFERQIRCPCCSGELSYLKILAKENKGAYQKLIQDFSVLLKLYRTEDYLLLETQSISCTCGFITSDTFTFSK